MEGNFLKVGFLGQRAFYFDIVCRSHVFMVKVSICPNSHRYLEFYFFAKLSKNSISLTYLLIIVIGKAAQLIYFLNYQFTHTQTVELIVFLLLASMNSSKIKIVNFVFLSTVFLALCVTSAQLRERSSPF